MLWIALVCPDLPLQVFSRNSPEPGVIAVISAHPAQRIVAASRVAQDLGIRPGDRVASARALASQLVLVTRDPSLESETLAELANWAGRFTPSISIAPPDAILLEVEACLRLFGNARHLMDALASGLQTLGLKAAMACAPTPLAAQWLAIVQPDALLDSASDWAHELDPLPIALLGRDTSVSQASLELLQAVGIRRIGEARRLPRDALARRQATEVLRALARARGEAPDPRPWHVPPERYESRMALPVATATVEPLLFAIGRLVSGMVAWLEGLHAAIERFELLLEHERGEATIIEVITGQATRDAGRLMLLAREHLAARALPAPVEVLRLRADSPQTCSGHTTDLFGDPGQVRESATLLLDRLRARLGKDCVRGIHPWPDHRPEKAWRMNDDGAPSGTAALPSQRPVWLLHEPRAIASIRQLCFVSGPERIESGWWDGDDVRRDYFVARAPDAGLWWIFRDLENAGKWYVHGYFG